MEEEFKQVLATLARVDTKNGNENGEEGSGTKQHGDSSRENESKHVHFSPKVEFPKFDGSNPKHWVNKARKNFNLCKVPQEEHGLTLLELTCEVCLRYGLIGT